MNESGARKDTNPSRGRPAGEVHALHNTPGDLFWEMNKPGAAFEQNVVGIVVVRADGTIAYINPYFAGLIGELPADLVGKPILDFAAEQDKATIAGVVTDCISGKRPFVQFESTVTHKSGNIVDIFINAATAVFEGQPAAIGVVIDISARKQAEQALAGSEAKLQAALSNMSQGLLMLDAKGGLVLFNHRFAEIFGLPPEQIRVGMTTPELMALALAASGVGDANPEATLAQQEKILRNPAGGTYVQHLTDGRSLAASFQPMPDGGLVVTFEDITQKMEEEQALTASELKLQTALSNMSQGLLMHDAEGRVILINRRFAEIFGLPPDQSLVGMAIPELMALAASISGVQDVNPEGTVARIERSLNGTEEESDIHHMSDGRSIAAARRPMPGGGMVVTFEDITAKLEAEEKIRHLAQYDALTNLPNRVSFYDQMDIILKHQRPGASVGVLSLDLDHFKAVNDTLGHPIGDLLLQAAAQRMQSCLRGGDIAARLGGDEFAILLIPVEKPADITALATRLIEVIGAPFELDNRQVIVGVSVGVAMAPEDGNESDALMKKADLALYRAKADGGGVYRFFEAEMDAQMQARRVIELDLRRAINKGDEFELLYQPIIDIKSGKVTSCEALLRWNNPERGLVMPADFIPVAEATGLIVPLGEWVLQHACKEAMSWPQDIRVAINLSPAQFKSKNIIQVVKDALASSELPPGRLELEITELVLLEDSESAFAILHQLRDLGIRIAMDDFGTGYSSLGYLRSFPFSTIKIDQSFIRDLPGKEDSLAIVRAVVGLSSSLGIQTIAEGVETEEQFASLAAEGCTQSQGFLFSKPRPSSEVEQFFKEQAEEPKGK